MARADELLGVWRLEPMTHRGRPVPTGQTHLVIDRARLWEVWPRQIVYEDEAGPEREYTARARDDVFEIDVTERGRRRLGLAAIDHEGVLHLAFGLERRPHAIVDDESSHQRYRLEPDESTRARLAGPVTRVQRGSTSAWAR